MKKKTIMVKIIDEDKTYYITEEEARLIENAKTFTLPTIKDDLASFYKKNVNKLKKGVAK